MKRFLVLFFVFVGSIGFACGLTHNHLRILDLLEQNKSRILPNVFGDEPKEFDYDDTWKGAGNPESFESLVLSVYRLKHERDETIFLLSRLVEAAREDDSMAEKIFLMKSGGDLGKVGSELSDQLLSRYDQSFNWLAQILGVENVREIAGAVLHLRQEWFEARKMLENLTSFAQKSI